MGDLVALDKAKKIREEARCNCKLVVFTNGCFDLLHRGHVEFLAKARSLGDILFVGLNSNSSVQQIKGRERPFVNELDRAIVLSSLFCVDYVLIFNELTPDFIIKTLIPDVLVKGGDWPVEAIVGREVVESAGGRVLSLASSVPNYSTSNLAKCIVASVRRHGEKEIK